MRKTWAGQAIERYPTPDRDFAAPNLSPLDPNREDP